MRTIYKITNITTRNGEVKSDKIAEYSEKHPNLTGYIVDGIENVGKEILERYKTPFCFIWNDDSGEMLRTSSMEDIICNDDIITVITLNSIYTIERVGKE